MRLPGTATVRQGIRTSIPAIKNYSFMEKKEILIGKTLPELEELCARLGFPRFTARQIADWLYKKRVRGIESMTNISVKNRERLSQAAEIGCQEPLQSQRSKDGTEKYLFSSPVPPEKGAETQAFIESVYIPEHDRATLCVSSQSGCRMNCAFCATGGQGFNHHLQQHEILNQFYCLPQAGILSNIVVMGMGEPLDNTGNVLRFLDIMTAPWGFAWSPYRITLSSVGILPGLERFLNESLCHLAISLHDPFSQERATLMPVEKTYPIEKVIQRLRQYPWNRQRRLSFEYILIKDLNDSPAHAEATARLLHGLECRVNLIACHEVPGKPFHRTSQERADRFQQSLQRNGLICTQRKSRGEDIKAACGLLAKTKQTQ